MEPNEPTLIEEVAHDKAIVRSEVTIGALVILVLILGGIIWYMAENPAPIVSTGGTATTTNATQGAATAAPGKIDDHGAYYDITATYPTPAGISATAGAASDAAAVALMKQFDMGVIAQFKQDTNVQNLSAQDIKIQGLGPDKKYSLAIDYQTYHSSHLVSYVFQANADTLGAHPNSTYQTFNFDTKTGTDIYLRNLFVPGTDYLSMLSKIARAQLPALIAKREGIKAADVDQKMLTNGTVAADETFSAWYVDGSNLVIIFPPYQVAAYAAGTQVLTIPFSKLSGVAATYK